MVKTMRMLNFLKNRGRAFKSDERGVSAVEFSLILPLLITLFLGGVELRQALTIDRKVTSVASALADLTTQVQAVSNADINNIFNASAAILSPYPSGNVQMVITRIDIDGASNSRVVWSDARNRSPHGTGSAINVPSQIRTSNTSLIMAEVKYTYNPGLGEVLTGPIQLSEKFYLRPRIGSAVARN